MKPEAHIQTSIELLEEFSIQNKPFKRFFPAYIRMRRYIGSKDRKAIFQYSMDIFRNYFSLMRCAQALQIEVNFRSLMLIYLKLCIQKETSDIHLFFTGGYGPPPLTETEAKALSLLTHGESFEQSLEAPDFLLSSLMEYYGETILGQLSFISQNILPAYFRINPHKIHIDAISEDFKTQNLPLLEEDEEARLQSPHPYLLRFFENIDLKNHPFYKEGLIEVQDKGSQILCQLIKTKPDEYLWDFCAGGGGKSLYIQSCQPTLNVILSDIHKVKLKNAQQRFKRAGLPHPQIINLPHDLSSMDKFKGKIEHLILDVPCSSMGTWQRNPDLKLRMNADYLAQIVQTQKDIFLQASPFIKSGGRLYYFTCSLLPQENEQQIKWFLENNSDFKEVNIKQENEYLDNDILFPYDKHKNSLTLTPKIHNCDGFFAAILEKK